MREFDFSFPDGMLRVARHRVRLYPCENWTTILVTDRSCANECASVTNSIEHLVNELVDKENLNPDRIVIIEHYDDLGEEESFDLVKLERRKDGTFTNPTWKRISRAEVENWCGMAASKAS
jgi:hypothetical protein